MRWSRSNVGRPCNVSFPSFVARLRACLFGHRMSKDVAASRSNEDRNKTVSDEWIEISQEKSRTLSRRHCLAIVWFMVCLLVRSEVIHIQREKSSTR